MKKLQDCHWNLVKKGSWKICKFYSCLFLREFFLNVRFLKGINIVNYENKVFIVICINSFNGYCIFFYQSAK
jgi:hypothetical protein